MTPHERNQAIHNDVKQCMAMYEYLNITIHALENLALDDTTNSVYAEFSTTERMTAYYAFDMIRMQSIYETLQTYYTNNYSADDFRFIRGFNHHMTQILREFLIDHMHLTQADESYTTEHLASFYTSLDNFKRKQPAQSEYRAIFEQALTFVQPIIDRYFQ